MEEIKSIPVLDSIEVRVLGSLMEKSKTTPDYYPMTVNAVTLACNQKSSRKPLVQYSDETVVSALNSLKRKGLVATVIGGGSRSLKYRHNFEMQYPLLPSEIAVICLLFLRGPLTPGEINSNSARLHGFASIESVLEVLEKLSQNNPPFVRLLPKSAGQKEQRYFHLFGEPVESLNEEKAEEPSVKTSSELESRLETVEKELAGLKAAFEKLYRELNG